MADSYYERRRKELGLASSEKSSKTSYYEARRMDLGIIHDTRPMGGKLQPMVSQTDYKALSRSLGNEPKSVQPEFLKPQAPLTAVDSVRQYQTEHPEIMQHKEELKGRDLPNLSTLYGIGNFLKGADEIQKLTEPAAKIAEPLYTPGAGPAAIAGFTRGVGSALARIAPSIAHGAGLGAKVAREAIKEGVTGMPVGVGQTLASNPGASNREIAGGAAFGAGLGAVGGAAVPIVGKGVNAVFGKLLKRNGVPEKQAQEILALPMGREDAARLRRAPQNGGSPIVNPYTFALPEPSVAPPTRARVAQQANPYREQFENLMKTAQKMQSEGKFTPGREEEELHSLWSQMAGREAPSLDELINLAYKPRPNRLTPDLAQAARSGQRAREVAGVPLPVKSVSDRMPPQGALASVESPITVPRGLRQEPIAESPKPTEPRVSAPRQEPEQILQASQPRVRDRVYDYLDEAEKAARQRIAKRRNVGIIPGPGNDVVDYAIIGAAKIGKGTIKFSDWTEEMVKEFGEEFREKAPRIFQAAKEELRKQERRASKEGQAAAAFNSGEGDANSFMQKISHEAPKTKRSLAEITEKARAQTVDDLAALEGLEKNVRGRVSSAEDSLYKSGRNYRGLPAKALQIVQDRLTPIAQDVERTGFTMDDLGAYALAKHAQDVNEAGYKSGFTDKEIADVLSKFGTPEMEAVRKKLIQINDDMLQQLVNSGVVSKELASTLRERWPNYVPLFRQLEDEAVGFEGGLSKALANVASPIKALKGSEKKVIDPLENMVRNIFQSTSAAERNKVALQLAKLADQDASETFIRKLGPDEEVGRKNVLNVKIDGKNVKYEVQPEVYKAMLNLDQESSNMLIKALQAPASLLRSGATLTPEFSLRNPMRDVIQAFIVSESGFNPIIDFPVGLIQTIKKGNLYKQWVDNMGDFGNVVSMDRNAHKEALRKVLGERNSKKFVNIVNGKGLMRLLRAITDTTESATKVGEFRAALRKGASPQEAAFRSRDIMDFGRSGSAIRQTNKVIAFLNANIQGKSKLIRAAKADPIGVSTRAFVAVTLPTVGAFLMTKYLANDTQKQTIAESPNWLKDSFWLIPIPGTDVVARIPKPFDLAPIFSNLPERALEFAYNKDKEAFDGFARRSLASYAIPVQITGLLPFVEGMANYSFFREGPIIPEREQGLLKKDQYDPVRTTETGKLLAGLADKITGGQGPFKNFGSPRIMDNTIQGLTAGLGSYATSAIDSILQGKIPFTNFKVGPAAVDRPSAPAKRLEQQPLARAFLVDPLQSTRTMDKLYTRKEELSDEKSSAKLNKQPFDKGKLRDLKGLESTADKLSTINKQIRQIESSRDLLPTQKREQIDVLLRKKNDLARTANSRGLLTNKR